MNLIWYSLLTAALAGPGPDGTLPPNGNPPAGLPGGGGLMRTLLGKPTTVKPGMTRAQALAALKKEGYPVQKILNRQADTWLLSNRVESGCPIPGGFRNICVTFQNGQVKAASVSFISN
jgi:hypothetical protein